VAGCAGGPKDIPDSVVQAGAAALEAAAYLRARGWASAARDGHHRKAALISGD